MSDLSPECAPKRTSARQDGLAYGLVTAVMALLTGWMASIVFRKD